MTARNKSIQKIDELAAKGSQTADANLNEYQDAAGSILQELWDLLIDVIDNVTKFVGSVLDLMLEMVNLWNRPSVINRMIEIRFYHNRALENIRTGTPELG